MDSANGDALLKGVMEEHAKEELACQNIKTGSVDIKSSSTVPQVECLEEEINIDCVVTAVGQEPVRQTSGETIEAPESEGGSPDKPKSAMAKLKHAMMK